MSRAAAVRRGALLAGPLGAALVVLLLGVLLEQVVLVAVGGVGVYVLDALLHRRLVRALPRQEGLLTGQQHVRLLLADALVVAFAMRLDAPPGVVQGAVVTALVASQAATLIYSLLQVTDARLRSQRPELHNVSRPIHAPPRSSLLLEPGRLVVAHAGLLLPAALGVAGLTGSYGLLLVAAAAVVLVPVAVVLGATPGVVRLARTPRGDRLLRLVQDAVLEAEPAVVLYSPGQAGSYHWVRPWLDILEHLGQPAVIMLRHPSAVDAIGRTSVPVVCLPQGRDVRRFRLPERCVALYVANATENLPFIKNPALRSAFVGHGDSDKATSASPASKMYDEVWVAGESGRQRYVVAGVGVRPEDIRVVGRPQVRRVQPARQRGRDDPFTVLYAPTWEGPLGDPAVSSLLHSGRAIVTTLLACDGVRVLFRPHPATGNVEPAFARVSHEIASLLTDAGPQHAVVPPRTTDLYDCFNEADALIADLSGVISDFLASDKPYVIVNGSALSDHCFRERHPSAAGAYLVGPAAAGLPAALEDARGPDSMRQRRQEVRTWVLGPPTADPVQVFAQAVQALAARH